MTEKEFTKRYAIPWLKSRGINMFSFEEARVNPMPPDLWGYCKTTGGSAWLEAKVVQKNRKVKFEAGQPRWIYNYASADAWSMFVLVLDPEPGLVTLHSGLSVFKMKNLKFDPLSRENLSIGKHPPADSPDPLLRGYLNNLGVWERIGDYIATNSTPPRP